MAIVRLSKLELYGVNEDKDLVLDILYKSKLVHIKNIKKVNHLQKADNENKLIDCNEKMKKVQTLIEYYEKSSKDHTNNEILIKEYDFLNFEKANQNIVLEIDNLSEIIQLLEEKNSLLDEIKHDKVQTENHNNEDNDEECKVISIINGKLNGGFTDDINLSLEKLDLLDYKLENEKIEIICLQENINKINVENLNINIENTELKNVKVETLETLINITNKIKENDCENHLKSGFNNVNLFKTYYDYLSYVYQKLEIEKNFAFTKRTFMIEGFIEEDKKQNFEQLLKSKNLAVSYSFSKPTNTDDVPTKTKNKKFVKPFEFVTNMYSVPKYNEIDPNFLLGLFFSLFFGFIMADIGYGILLVAIGLFLVLKKGTSKGMKDLMKVVAIGGVFAIAFGLMFGSFLGYTHNDMSFIPKALLPDPSKNVMMYLIASVVIGAIQLMVGFALKGILLVRRGKIAEAICSAFSWDIFFIGAGIFALDLVKVTDGLMFVGLGIAIFGIATAVVGNIFINKGFDRVAKSFGSLYSILNLFSDLLSYTRLFGLMLSGVIIASIVNQLAGGFYTVAWKVPFGIIISLIGHAFNISMGALGAYIHDARLQYIEFFSRFYEGEGELFTPFGSNFSYIKLVEMED